MRLLFQVLLMNASSAEKPSKRKNITDAIWKRLSIRPIKLIIHFIVLTVQRYSTISSICHRTWNKYILNSTIIICVTCVDGVFSIETITKDIKILTCKLETMYVNIVELVFIANMPCKITKWPCIMTKRILCATSVATISSWNLYWQGTWKIIQKPKNMYAIVSGYLNLHSIYDAINSMSTIK